MGLSIKRVETERKARAVAERMGVGVTEAIDRALEKTWLELTAEDQAADRARKRAVFFDYLDTLPKPVRSQVEVEAEMYGDHGEPI
jgi:antitoxin VapB